MGCTSSSTIPEANVQKQRRRLSVGNVDTSEVHEARIFEDFHGFSRVFR